MPARDAPSPLLATLAAAGGLALLLFGRNRPAPAGGGATDRRPHPAGSPAGGRFPHDGARGRDAASPAEVPPRGWWEILKRTASEVSRDRVLSEAAGITFYALLSLFPAIGALIAIYGLFADPATIGQHLDTLGTVVPGGGMQIIQDQVQRIASKGSTTLGVGAVIGLLTSLWSANQAMKALVDVLNIVYEEEEQRGFVARTLLTLAFTIAGILFILLAIAAVVVLPVMLNLVGFGGGTETMLRWARWPLLLVGVGLFLACVYRYGPCRARKRWRWVTVGSGVAAFAWIAGSLLFSWYVTQFGNYNETYGSLGAVIGFMTWLWLSSTVVLVGAELDAELEHQTARDTTTGHPKPLGARRARMADTVAS